jgi:hypothetical protein
VALGWLVHDLWKQWAGRRETLSLELEPRNSALKFHLVCAALGLTLIGAGYWIFDKFGPESLPGGVGFALIFMSLTVPFLMAGQAVRQIRDWLQSRKRESLARAATRRLLEGLEKRADTPGIPDEI